MVNKLSLEQYLLNKVSEECVETAQRANKAISFGLYEIQEGQFLNNAERLIYEFNDIMVILELMRENGMIGNFIDREAIDEKKEKVKKYLKHSQSLGIV